MFLLRVAAAAEVSAPSESDGDGQNLPHFEPTFADLEAEFRGPVGGIEGIEGADDSAGA